MASGPPSERVITLVVLVIGACLLIIISGVSLERADKIAGSLGGLIALALIVTALFREESSQPQLGGGADRKGAVNVHNKLGVESLLVSLAIIVVLLTIGFLIIRGMIHHDRTSTAGNPSAAPIASTTTTASTTVTTPTTTTTSTTTANAHSSQTEGSPGSSTSKPPDCMAVEQPPQDIATTGEGDAIRHDDLFSLTPQFGADLDSICLDWEVAGYTNGGLDLVNTGVGISASSNSSSKLAPLKPAERSDLRVCVEHTDYLSGVIKYADLKPGSRYCLSTSAGRRSLVEVVSVTPLQQGAKVDLKATTWERRVDARGGDEGWIIAAVALLLLLVAGGGARAARGSEESNSPAKDRSKKRTINYTKR